MNTLVREKLIELAACGIVIGAVSVGVIVSTLIKYARWLKRQP